MVVNSSLLVQICSVSPAAIAGVRACQRRCPEQSAHSIRNVFTGRVIGKTRISPMMQQALRFVPIAMLSALIVPSLFFPKGLMDLSLGNIRLIAGILSICVAWRTKNVLLTIVMGMVCWFCRCL